jgi:hypothetical protein
VLSSDGEDSIDESKSESNVSGEDGGVDSEWVGRDPRSASTRTGILGV